MNINSKDGMEFFVEDDKIIIRKNEPPCIFCGNISDRIEYEGSTVCKECIE